MKKQAKILLAVGAVFLVLTGALVFLLLSPPAEEAPSSESASSTAVELITREKAELLGISVKGAGNLEARGDGAEAVVIDELKGLPTNAGITSGLAKYATTIVGQQEIDDGGDLEQFGLGASAPVVTIKYKDGESALLRIGNSVPGAQTPSNYVLFNEKVYVMYNLHIKYFLYQPAEILDMDITPDVLDPTTGNTLYTFSAMYMGGSVREKPFNIEQTETFEAAGTSFTNYSITSPAVYSYTYNESGTTLLTSGFALDALSVAAYNVKTEDLAQYGLDEPYSTLDMRATLSADGSDGSFKLICSKPADGKMFVMRDDIPIVYVAAQPSGASWVDAQYQDYINSILLMPNISTVSKLEVSTPSGRFIFELKNEDKLQNDGTTAPELSAVSASSDYPNVPLTSDIADLSNFRKYYQVLIATGKESWTDEVPSEEERVPLLRVTYYYTKGGSDYIEFYEGPVRQVYVGVNGDVQFLTKSGSMDKILSDSIKVIAGEPVETD